MKLNKLNNLKLIIEWEYNHNIINQEIFDRVKNNKQKYIEEYLKYIISQIEFYLNIKNIGLKLMIIKIFFKKEKILILISFVIVFYINFFEDVNLINNWILGLLIVNGFILILSLQSLYYRYMFEKIFRSKKMQEFVLLEYKNNHIDNKKINNIKVTELVFNQYYNFFDKK